MEIIVWYIALLLLGLAFIPIGVKLFGKLADKAYPFYRLISLVIVSFIAYVLSYTHLIGFNFSPFVGIILLVVASSWTIYKYRIKLNKSFLKQMMIYEAIFLVIFVLLVLYRCYKPDISDLEKFTDMAFLETILKTVWFPAQDPWFAGHPMNYYYFGQIMAAVMTKISVAPVFIAYNIMLSTSYAIVIVGMGSIGYNIFKKVSASIILVISVAIMSNLTFISNAINGKGITWWEGIRQIPGSINDFPFYSLMSGDLHAHYLALPLVALLILLCYQYFYLNDNRQVFLIFMGFILGISFLTNSWDIIIYLPLFLLLVLIKFTYHKISPSEAIKSLLVVGATIGMSVGFHLLTFKSVINGLKVFSGPYTNLVDFFILYSYQSTAISLYIAYKFIVLLLRDKSNKKKHYFFLADAIVIALITLVIFGPLAALALLALQLIIYIVYRDLRSNKNISTENFIQVLIIASISIVIFCEIFYFDDPVGDPYERANTCFKLYYQFWIISSVASAFILLYFVKIKPKAVSNTFIFIIISLLVLNCASSFYRLSESAGQFKTFRGLDGTKYLAKSAPDEYEAIKWINANIKNQVAIAEKHGIPYTSDNKISTFTGNPTPMGWYGHIWTWHNNPDEISSITSDIDTLYTSKDNSVIETLVKKYKINYIYIGPLESAKYTNQSQQTIANMYRLVYSNNSVWLYQTNIH